MKVYAELTLHPGTPSLAVHQWLEWGRALEAGTVPQETTYPEGLASQSDLDTPFQHTPTETTAAPQYQPAAGASVQPQYQPAAAPAAPAPTNVAAVPTAPAAPKRRGRPPARAAAPSPPMQQTLPAGVQPGAPMQGPPSAVPQPQYELPAVAAPAPPAPQAPMAPPAPQHQPAAMPPTAPPPPAPTGVPTIEEVTALMIEANKRVPNIAFNVGKTHGWFRVEQVPEEYRRWYMETLINETNRLTAGAQQA